MYSQIAANKRNTFLLITLLLTVFIGFGVWMSYEVQDPTVFISFAIVTILITVIQYLLATRQLLTLTHAVEATSLTQPNLVRKVENLSITAGIPIPKVYIIPDDSLNAFAAGSKPEKAIVGVTSGLLNSLDDNELEGVLAHEIAHIKNYDIKVSTLIFAFSIAILFIGEFLLRIRMGKGNPFPVIGFFILVIGYPIVMMVRLAISRQREFLADASSVELTRYPDGLVSALKKIGQSNTKGNLEPAASHMFFINETKGFLDRLFSTHPPVEERIKRLGRSLNSM
jgi:heat shock protein HtpX